MFHLLLTVRTESPLGGLAALAERRRLGLADSAAPIENSNPNYPTAFVLSEKSARQLGWWESTDKATVTFPLRLFRAGEIVEEPRGAYPAVYPQGGLSEGRLVEIALSLRQERQQQEALERLEKANKELRSCCSRLQARLDQLESAQATEEEAAESERS